MASAEGERRILAGAVLALLAVLGFTAAGCASSMRPGPTISATTGVVTLGGPALGSITVTGTTTISNVDTATRIKCKGWLGRGVPVPAPRGEEAVSQATMTQSGTRHSPLELQATRPENGPVTVSCTPTH